MIAFRSALVSGLVFAGLLGQLVLPGFSTASSLLEQPTDPFGCATQGENLQSCNRAAIAAQGNRNLHTLGYKQARERMFQFVDVYESADGERVVDSVYSNHVFPVGAEGIPQNGVNTEHTWPQSFLKKFPRSDQTVCDLFHLFPVESGINGARGNTQFAECPGEPDATGRVSESCSEGFEPPEVHKGIVARAMFYLSVVYDLSIDPGQERVLRKWNKEHPVTELERERASRIQEVQGNQNPFVSHPEWADVVSDF